MLNTFENAETFHTRRLERERHLANIEIFSNVIEHDDDAAVLSTVDALAGLPLAKSEEQQQNNSTRKPAPFCFLCFAGVFIFAVVSIISAWGGVKYEDKSSAQREISSVATMGPNSRFQLFYSIVLDWGLTTRSQLEDTFSPTRKALNWLVEVDTRTTSHEDIRTRYALATLYFGTQNSSAGYVWTWSTYWLSDYPVCLWYGVYCLEDGLISVRRVGALNLSSNGKKLVGGN